MPRPPICEPAAGLRLLIVDDHALVCAGLAMMFRTVADVAEVAVATRPAAALRTAPLFRPDVALVDVTLPPADAFETAHRLSRSRIRILFMDDAVHAVHVRMAVRMGALGYWTKHAAFDQLAEAVRRVAAGEPSFCAEAAPLVTRTPAGLKFHMAAEVSPLARLTPRELEVLGHLADGLTVKRCALRMDLAESTVDNHKSRLMRKLNVHNVAQLVRLAGREGLVEM